MKQSVSIVIPNWNGKDLLAKNLPFVMAAVGDAEVIVVDDGSTDDSVAFLKEKFPNISVISKKNHEGFASTVNVGVSHAKGEIVILLNTDVRPTKTFLLPLVKHFEDQSVFAVGCLDKSHENGRIELRGRGVAAWKKGFFIHGKGDVKASSTAWVSGGSGAFRKAYWQKLGGMDTLFNPFYWEDIDLSYRALKAGYALVFEPQSIVDHFHEKGKILGTYTAEQIQKISYRNQFIFIWKNLTDCRMMAQHLFLLPVWLLRTLINGNTGMLKGFLSACTKLPDIMVKRKKQQNQIKVSDRSVQLS